MKERNISLKKLREHHNLAEQSAGWFSSKWEIPVEAYQESIQECVMQCSGIPQWYVMINERREIIAGAGVIKNDFHNRKDLTPNLCALFVEEEYRRQGIARRLLNEIRRDMYDLGIKKLYLVTDHTEFYEKCEWNFLTMVRDDSNCMERMYVAGTKKA